MLFQTVPLVQANPRAPQIIIALILISIMIGYYVYFGLEFIWKGVASKNPVQKSYYKGLGTFIMTVALSEGIYVTDFLWRVIYGERIFKEISYWEDTLGIPEISTIFPNDYYVPILMLLSFGLIFLCYPLEKYLLDRKRKVLTIYAAISVPFPLMARLLEINAYSLFGMEVKQGSFIWFITTLLWITGVFIVAVSILILFSLYLKMGFAAPPGSKLRRKSRFIVIGLILWLIGIFSTSSVLKEIWTGDLINLMPLLYTALPLVLPSIFGTSLAMISYGFRREY